MPCLFCHVFSGALSFAIVGFAVVPRSYCPPALASPHWRPGRRVCHFLTVLGNSASSSAVQFCGWFCCRFRGWCCGRFRDRCRDSVISDVSSPLNTWASDRKSEVVKKKKDKQKGSVITLLAASKLKRSIIKKVLKTSDALSYEESYQGFLGPYHAHANINPMESKVVMDTLQFLDSDGSG